MLHSEFFDYENRIAVGLIGQGSECFGFDDEYSKDHDFGERLCLWITKEDDEKIGFSLHDAYSKIAPKISDAADERSGIFNIHDFYSQIIGHPGVPKVWQDWFTIPEHSLASATNGKIFRDDIGKFTAIYTELSNGFPRDIFLKKLSAHLALMAQSGQYNAPRCQKRGENGAAALAIHEFIDHAFHVLFLLNNRYTPFYKWRFRAAKELPIKREIAYKLEELILDFSPKHRLDLIEQIAIGINNELNRRGLTNSESDFLEVQAKEILCQIKTAPLRAMHLMEFGAD